MTEEDDGAISACAPHTIPRMQLELYSYQNTHDISRISQLLVVSMELVHPPETEIVACNVIHTRIHIFLLDSIPRKCCIPLYACHFSIPSVPLTAAR